MERGGGGGFPPPAPGARRPEPWPGATLSAWTQPARNSWTNPLLEQGLHAVYESQPYFPKWSEKNGAVLHFLRARVSLDFGLLQHHSSWPREQASRLQCTPRIASPAERGTWLPPGWGPGGKRGVLTHLTHPPAGAEETKGRSRAAFARGGQVCMQGQGGPRLLSVPGPPGAGQGRPRPQARLAPPPRHGRHLPHPLLTNTGVPGSPRPPTHTLITPLTMTALVSIGGSACPNVGCYISTSGLL